MKTDKKSNVYLGQNHVDSKTKTEIDNTQIKLIENYLNERCKTDKTLQEKMTNSGKTIQGAYNFLYKELESLARLGKMSSAMCENDYVYSQIVHYFLEDSLNNEPKAITNSSNSAESVEEIDENDMFASDSKDNVEEIDLNDMFAKTVKKTTKSKKAKVKVNEVQMSIYDFLDCDEEDGD